jgi:FkbM family methyltransferase
MNVISKSMHKLRQLTYFIENPRLFSIRKKGGITDTFRMLNQRWFHEIGIATVLDIGANTGQFAVTINALLPEATIYSFEPIPDCFEQLNKRMLNVKNFTSLNIALGDDSSQVQFELNSYSPSSSFLSMSDLHKTVYPFTKKSQLIDVKVKTLDTVAETLDINAPIFVKLDVQGYEEKVIRGGEKTIKNAKIIMVEILFETLYEEQAVFDNIYRTLVDWEFEYKGIVEQAYNPDDGKVLYADAIFIKRS